MLAKRPISFRMGQVWSQAAVLTLNLSDYVTRAGAAHRQQSRRAGAIRGMAAASPHRRKRRRFSRRKVKKVTRWTLIITLHVIAIALLIYIWIKFATSPGFTG